jgi:Tfp pilus assembly protein PilF
VDRLLEESRRQLVLRDWHAAIASAERGLRIDRREAELYLMIAEGYRGLGDDDRSVQFARQGLRHAKQGSRIADALHNLVAAGEM